MKKMKIPIQSYFVYVVQLCILLAQHVKCHYVVTMLKSSMKFIVVFGKFANYLQNQYSLLLNIFIIIYAYIYYFIQKEESKDQHNSDNEKLSSDESEFDI